MAEKKFIFTADQIKAVARGHGGCMATDMITVNGHKVGFMYREEPSYAEDSGWRFLSGKESQEYLDEPNNLGIYDVNTIANYDSGIIPLLDAPIGSAFERRGLLHRFVEVQFDPDDQEND